MQKRQDVYYAGAYGALRAKICGFVNAWPGKVGLKERDLYELANIATAPFELLRSPEASCKFAAKFCLAPDFVPAFITFIRALWFKDSKRARLRNYLATTAWHDKNFGRRYDKQTQFDYQDQTKEAVSIKQVEDARRDLFEQFKLGEKSTLKKSKLV